MVTIFLVLAGLYVLSTSRMAAPAPTPTQPATGTFTPGGTRISIPGVGDYVNIPGGGVSVTIDPSFYGTLFGSTTTPTIQQPSPSPDYQAYDIVGSPVDPYPYYGFVA